jgi:UTP--glucose-1-phosphate uridylyltransferase
VYNQHEEAVVALEEVDAEHVSRYGIADATPLDGRTYQVSDLVEKPTPEDAPSNLAIASRYILPPEIFPALEMTGEGSGGEIQLTDALRTLLQERSMYGYRINGVRHDIGNKLDFVKTSILFALSRDDIGPDLREWLERLVADSEVQK